MRGIDKRTAETLSVLSRRNDSLRTAFVGGSLETPFECFAGGGLCTDYISFVLYMYKNIVRRFQTQLLCGLPFCDSLCKCPWIVLERNIRYRSSTSGCVAHIILTNY